MADSAPACDADYYDALILYAQTVVNSNAGNAPNTAALVNPHGLPMEVLEIRFRVYPQNELADDFGTLTGLSIGVKLDLGSIAVCDQEVPLSGFGNMRDVDDNAGTVIPVPAVANSPTTQTSMYSWRLKYPLLVPAGAVLTPTFAHLGQNPFPVVVDTVYYCRNLPPNYRAPETTMVPWVTAYNSNNYDTDSAVAATEQSDELAIVNNFDVPMEISRLVGAVTLNANNAASEDTEDHRFMLGKVSIRGSRGDEIARAPTVFNGLWPVDWRAWDIPGGWIFRPGEFYKIIFKIGAEQNTPDTTQLGRVQYSLTAVGYRPMNTRDVLVHALEASQQ